jgi:hypothetical protein
MYILCRFTDKEKYQVIINRRVQQSIVKKLIPLVMKPAGSDRQKLTYLRVWFVVLSLKGI